MESHTQSEGGPENLRAVSNRELLAQLQVEEEACHQLPEELSGPGDGVPPTAAAVGLHDGAHVPEEKETS